MILKDCFGGRRMNKLKCEECGKVVEGYNKNHVAFLMVQHKLKHRKKNHNKTNKEDKQCKKV